MTWTSYNMVAQITQGTTTVALTYDSDHQRISQTIGGSSPSTTYYLNALGAMSEKYIAGGTTTWHDYIQADGHIVAEKFSGGTTAMHYFVLDQLGSIAVVMDDAGTVLERLSYDAWGKRRNANGTGGASCFTGSSTTRGFTGQEEIDGVGLVNLNARIYDPVLGRFMSADPTVEAPYIPQDFNRYTYVGNNPLSFTDPSGLCFLGCFWKSPIFAAVVAVAIAVFVPQLLFLGPGNVFAAAALGNMSAIGAIVLGGALAGGISAGLTGGNIFAGIIFGGITAGLMAGMGGGIASELDMVFKEPLLDRMIAYGFVGGMTSSIQGGNFGSGFLAAGFGALGGGLGGGAGYFGKMLVSAAVGGAASVLGGGKFANGAVTAAFAYAASTLGREGVNQSRDAYGRYGPTQQGTIDCGDVDCRYAYSTYQTDTGLQGARLSVYYPGNGDEDWVQTYTATSPVDDSLPHMDCAHSPCPFSGPQGNKFFDSPGRYSSSATWSAQTSVVLPNGSGGYSPVTTFTWGFRLSPTSISLLPIHVVPPSNFQLQAIGSAHQ